MKVNVPQYLKNKYILTLAVYGVWMLFLNDIDLIYILRERISLGELKQEVQRLEEDTQRAKEALFDITHNEESLEKFAREEYLMRKPNEELFLIREMKPEQ